MIQLFYFTFLHVLSNKNIIITVFNAEWSFHFFDAINIPRDIYNRIKNNEPPLIDNDDDDVVILISYLQ